jgi:hypothetical protein
MKHIIRFNESKEEVVELTIDSKVKTILDKLSEHENSRVKSISKTILKNFSFGSVTGGRKMKIARVIQKQTETQFPDGSIEFFVVAFAALNDGTSIIKIK